MSPQIAPLYTRMILAACEEIQTFTVKDSDKLRRNIRKCLNRLGYYHDVVKLASTKDRIVAYKKNSIAVR